MPYDVHLLLASSAPRPLLVVHPTLDRESELEDATKAVTAAKEVYAFLGAAAKLEQLTPEDHNRFGPELQNPVLAWLNEQGGR